MMVLRILKKSSLFRGIFVLILTVFVQPVLAGKWGGTPSGQDCTISEVFVDWETNPPTIIIYGRNFVNGDDPIVTLGDFGALIVKVHSTGQLIAEMPLPIEDGDYLLALTTGSSAHQYDTATLTIGAVGPQGEQGPQDPAGADVVHKDHRHRLDRQCLKILKGMLGHWDRKGLRESAVTALLKGLSAVMDSMLSMMRLQVNGVV